VRFHLRPRVVHVDDPAGRPVGLRLGRGEQRPVDPVPGHQLGGLGGERLSLGGGRALGFCLGEQLAHPL
jgi:hypothetical protein